MQAHEWLTQEIASLGWYAHFLREAVLDPSLPPLGRALCAGAGKYLVEWDDLITDLDPMFGYMDDLFAVLVAFDDMSNRCGEAVTHFLVQELPTGVPLIARMDEAKGFFPGFFSFMTQELSHGFAEVADAVEANPTLYEDLGVMLKNYIDGYTGRAVIPIDSAALHAFMDPYDRGDSAG